MDFKTADLLAFTIKLVQAEFVRKVYIVPCEKGHKTYELWVMMVINRSIITLLASDFEEGMLIVRKPRTAARELPFIALEKGKPLPDGSKEGRNGE